MRIAAPWLRMAWSGRRNDLGADGGFVRRLAVREGEDNDDRQGASGHDQFQPT